MIHPQRYRTKLCDNFMNGRACPYAPNCAFAHGDHELRSVEVNLTEGLQQVNTLPLSVFEKKQTREMMPPTSPQSATSSTTTSNSGASTPTKFTEGGMNAGLGAWYQHDPYSLSGYRWGQQRGAVDVSVTMN